MPPYSTIIERAAHRKEDSLTSTDVAAHWHDHFADDVGDSEQLLNAQVVCFFQIAAGAALGNLIVGRKGGATRFSFSVEALRRFIDEKRTSTESSLLAQESLPEIELDAQPQNEGSIQKDSTVTTIPSDRNSYELGQAIFIAHGKNKKPLEQLKRILDQFRIPYKVAIDEPNLGRPISGKIREVMRSCNCAILIFTADEDFKDEDGNAIWRPSENVVYELGAAGYLYDNRIVIMKEERVSFPSNFSDIGYISFETDQLEAKTMDILKELIGFGIVKISI